MWRNTLIFSALRNLQLIGMKENIFIRNQSPRPFLRRKCLRKSKMKYWKGIRMFTAYPENPPYACTLSVYTQSCAHILKYVPIYAIMCPYTQSCAQIRNHVPYTQSCAHIRNHVPIYAIMCPYTQSCAHIRNHVPIYAIMCPYTQSRAHIRNHVPIYAIMCPYTQSCAKIHKVWSVFADRKAGKCYIILRELSYLPVRWKNLIKTCLKRFILPFLEAKVLSTTAKTFL